MTNKEAIERLNLMQERCCNGYDAEAIYLAIKALDDKEERPQGEWIVVGEEQGALGITYKIRKCSNCSWEHNLLIPDNFCPNCGADMRPKGEWDIYGGIL